MVTKHDQNRAEKRERLIRAAVDAFTETGFENTTVSDVVRRAGMTPSTFYNYYRDKDALRDELVEVAAGQMLEGLVTVRRKARGIEEYLGLVSRGLFSAMVLDRTMASLLRRNLPLLRSLLDAKALLPVQAALRSDLETAVSSGWIAPLDLEYGTAMLRASFFEIGVVLLTSSNPDLSAAVEFATRTLGSAFRTR